MPLVSCPTCEGSISLAAPICPHCGHPVGIQKSQTSSLWWLPAAIPLSLVLLAAIAFVVLAEPGDSRERRLERDAISECWKEQGRRSLPPAHARFVAGVCEKMERDFKAKFGSAP